MSNNDGEQLSDVMARVWARSRPVIDERVQVLRDAVDQLPGVEPAVRAEAYDAAHKLAGSLGTFGLMRASELALALELQLDPANLEPDLSKVPGLLDALANELP